MDKVNKWTFFGKVHPERVPVTWGTPLEGSGLQRLLGIEFKFRTIIHSSQVVVDLQITKGAPDTASLRNIAISCAKTITDLVGYKSANSFDVEIVSAICRDTNEWAVFGTELPVLAALRKNDVPGIFDGKLVEAVSRSVPAQMILADFREAMRTPVGTGFFCYRAVETMMQSMKETAGQNDAGGWRRLHEFLHTDRLAIDLIKRHADPSRHGKPSAITDDERAEVFTITDKIIDRYLTYLVNGKSALPVKEFPLLTA